MSARSVLSPENVIFAGVQWFFWSGFGMVFAFLAGYYQDIGFSSIEIGLVMALVSTANIVGQPILGIVSDRIGSPGRVLFSALIISTGLALSLYFARPSLVIVAVLSAVISFTAQTLPPIIDGWTMQVRDSIPTVDYGLTRAMGSVGFSITVALGGRLFDLWELRLMFPAAGLLFVLTAVFVAFGRRIPGASTPDSGSAINSTGSNRSAFFTVGTVTLLVLGFLTFTAFRPVQVFLPILIRSLGGTNTHIGYALAVMAFSEVPFMIVSSRLLRRFSDANIIMVSMVFFLLRILSHGLAPTPEVAIIVQLFQGASFGLYLPASVHLLNRLAPAGTGTFAQTAGSVATFGVGSIAGSALAGYLVDWIGLIQMYVVMGGLMAVVAVAFCLLFVWPGFLRLQSAPRHARST